MSESMPMSDLLKLLDTFGRALSGIRYAVDIAIEREKSTKSAVETLDAIVAPLRKGLTKPQAEELRAQLERGPQSTYGKHRARTQNSLVRRHLSEFLDENGKPTKPRGVAALSHLGLGGGYPDKCRITDAGVQLIAEYAAKRANRLAKRKKRGA